MSTNKSTNLNLHLWEPGDDFLRTEFNENFQKVDELAGKLLTPEGQSCQTGSFHFNGTVANGTALVSFSFSPHVLLMEFNSVAHMLTQGKSCRVAVGSSGYYVSLQLSGKSLILASNDSRITTSHSGNCAALP